MYNLFHGQNPDSDVLLSLVGLTRADVVRFRDAYITDQGIAIFTRNGGGNRECWCEDHELIEIHFKALKESGEFDKLTERERAHEYFKVAIGGTLEPEPDQIHEATCTWAANKKMCANPLFIKDEDDDYDFTYATFYFRIPPEFQKKIDELKERQHPDMDKTLKEKLDVVIAEVKRMTPEQLEKEFPEVTAAVKKISEFAREKKS